MRAWVAVAALTLTSAAGVQVLTSQQAHATASCSPDAVLLIPQASINVGGPQLNGAGQTWQADTGASGGTTRRVDERTPISGTDQPGLYRSSREGSTFSYSLPMPNDRYLVLLHMAQTSPAIYVQSINLNQGFTEVNRLAVGQQAGGSNRALVRGVETTVNAGVLRVAVKAAAGSTATLSGIQALRLARCLRPSPTTSSPTTSTSSSAAPSHSLPTSTQPTATDPTATPITSSATPKACNPHISVAEWVQQGISLFPVCNDGAWDFVIPANANPVIPRRTEAVWAWDGGLKRFHAGDTVNFHAVVTGKLGPVAQQDNDWHVVWQLQGLSDGKWVPPVMGFNIRHGKLRMGGGGGHPDHSYAADGHNYEWSVDLANYTDGQPYELQASVYLSPDPALAWVSATVNGVPVLDHYRPRSKTGYMPATMYPSQPELTSRDGLYRGTQNNAPIPTYEQSVRIDMIHEG